jgi:hypothetical protein
MGKETNLAWAAAGVCALLAYQHFTAESWSGFLYPNKDDLTRHLETGPFKTLADCRSAAIISLSTTTTPPGDYECGLNCRTDAGLGPSIKVCEVTER